jgi:hypothetical protein
MVDLDIDLLFLDAERTIIQMYKMKNKYSLEYRSLHFHVLDNLNKTYAVMQGN